MMMRRDNAVVFPLPGCDAPAPPKDETRQEFGSCIVLPLVFIDTLPIGMLADIIGLYRGAPTGLGYLLLIMKLMMILAQHHCR